MSVRHTRRWLATITLAVVPRIGRPQVHPTPAIALYAGTWMYAGGAAERQGVDRAIDRTIEGMAFFVVPFARVRLRDANRVSTTIDVRISPREISLSFDHRAPFRGPDDGTRFVTRTPDGDTVHCSLAWDHGHIVHVVGTDQGHRRNEFVVSPDGHSLRLDVTIASPSLPREMHYSLTFRR